MFIPKNYKLKEDNHMLHITDPDCYELVSISEDRSSTTKEPTTSTETTTTEPLFL